MLSRSADDPGITRLDPLAAVEQLLAHRHRPRVPALLGLRAQMLDICTVVARRVPVYAWRRDAIALGDRERQVLRGL